MKKIYTLMLVLVASVMVMAQALPPITFRGEKLEYDSTWTRKEVGWTPKYIPEVSGMSCSRVTPGYLWIQSDEVFRIAAISPEGSMYKKILLKGCPKYNGAIRRDWEGISTGHWNGKDYIFIGAFGDNDCQYGTYYYVSYLEEPQIFDTPDPDPIIDSINNNYIRYCYPDGKSHNTEAIMFDNVDQVLYIIDKEEKHFCHVYSLNMKDTVYPNDLQTLKYECDLGQDNEIEFQRVTAADMTPDGKWIIIKNNYYVTPAGSKEEETYAVALIWTREEGESVVDALKRQPKQILAYEVEWQGEAVAWLDSTTFYTCSDDDKSAPIYVYIRWGATGLEDINLDDVPEADKIMLDGQVYVRRKNETYNIAGQQIK